MEGGHGSSYYFCASSLPYTINPFLMCCPIKAGLYSATLTAFIVESRKKLTPDPSDEIVYYARQSVTLLVDLLQRVLPAKGGLSSDQVPEYIIDRFLTFLEGVLESRKRSHVGDPISRTEDHRERPDRYQCSVWTERVLVDLLQRVLPSAEGGSSSGQLSQKIIDRFLTLLADVLAKKEGPHVEDAISQII